MAKKLELYHKTVDILFQAYFNDTLRHGNCYACAVGNMIAANGGYKFETDANAEDPGLSIYWKGFSPYSSDSKDPVWPAWLEYVREVNYYRDDEEAAKEEVRLTGYSRNELMLIEHAFENAVYGNSYEDYMFNGLVAVLEVLKQIHEIEDNEPHVTRFRNHYNTKVF